MSRKLTRPVAEAAIATGLAYCVCSAALWATNLYSAHKKIRTEKERRPTLVVDEDLLVTKKRTFGQDRVQLTSDTAFWDLLQSKAATHTIVVNRRGAVSWSVIKQLCFNMHVPVSAKPYSSSPSHSYICLQKEGGKPRLQGLADRCLRALHLKRAPNTTICLTSHAETQYLPEYYSLLAEGTEAKDGQCKCVVLVNEIARLKSAEAAREDRTPSYPFYSQGSLQLATSQRLLRPPLISALQDQL